MKVGDRVVIHCGQWDVNAIPPGTDPMFHPSYRIWGYESNWGSFAQFTKVQAHQCMTKPPDLSWEASAAYGLVGCTAWRMLMGWPPHTVEEGDVVLVWGGSGGLGSMATQIVRERGGKAGHRRVVREPRRVHEEARRRRLHQPQGLLPLGTHARLDGRRRVRRVGEGLPRLRQGVLGSPRRAASRRASSSSTPDRTRSRRRSSSSTPAAWS